MADVSPLGVTDWGSMVNSFGQGQQQQRLTGSEADLAQQHALALQQQNQIMQASMPLIMQSVQGMQQERQNNADSSLDSDSSDAAPSGTTPGGFPVGVDNNPMEKAEAQAIAAQTSALPPAAGGSRVPASDQSSGVAPAPPVDSSSALDGGYIGRLDQSLRQALAVNDAGTPQEQQAIARNTLMAHTLGGLPGTAGTVLGGRATGALEQAKVQRQLGIEQRHMNSQLQSSNLFDKMRSVVDAGQDGQALYTLDAIDPSMAARIRSKVKDPEEQEADAMAYATHFAGEVHQYTGRGFRNLADGTPVDDLSGIPIPGAGRSGLSMQQRVEMFKSVLDPMAIPDGKGGTMQMAKWKVPVALGGLGASSPMAASMALAAAAGSPAAAVQVSKSAPAADLRNTASQVHATARSNAAPGTATSNPHGIATYSDPSKAPPAPTGTFPTDVNAPRKLGQDGYPIDPLPSPMPGAKDEDVWPVALRDRAFWTRNAPGVNNDPLNKGSPGTTLSTAQQGNVDLWKKNKADLQDWSQQTAAGTSQALMNFSQAQAILEGKYDGKTFNAIQGLPGDAMALLAKSGFNNVTAQNRAEVAKYLTNAATSISGGGTFTPPKSVEALRVNLDQALPNIDKMPTPSAINLIKSQIAQMQYARTAALRAPAAVANNVDPGQYGSFYEHFFPRAGAVQTAVSPPTVRMIKPDGTTGSVPASMQKGALARGYKLAPAVK